MAANNLHFNPFPSAQGSQHVFDVSSPSVPSHVASTCVHVREQDSHCEQCRQQIRSMSRSMLQDSSQDVIVFPTISRHWADLSSTRADISRQRRRASHCPSASDPSMTLFPSSPRESTTPVSTYPWRRNRGLRQLTGAGSQLRGPPGYMEPTSAPESPKNASSHLTSHESASAA